MEFVIAYFLMVLPMYFVVGKTHSDRGFSNAEKTTFAVFWPIFLIIWCSGMVADKVQDRRGNSLPPAVAKTVKQVHEDRMRHWDNDLKRVEVEIEARQNCMDTDSYLLYAKLLTDIKELESRSASANRLLEHRGADNDYSKHRMYMQLQSSYNYMSLYGEERTTVECGCSTCTIRQCRTELEEKAVLLEQVRKEGTRRFQISNRVHPALMFDPYRMAG